MVLPLHGDLSTIPAHGIQYAADDRVGTAVMQQAFGASGAALMASAILVSAFGCNHGLILCGARIYYAMVSGTNGQLLDLTMFAQIAFFILTIGGLFVLRRIQPDTPRPYRAIGYPVSPAIYIVMAVFIEIVLLRYKPQYTWPGLIIVLLGIPVYLFWSLSASVHGTVSELQNEAG